MRKTHEQFVNEIAKISPNIKIIGRYQKAVERIEVECKQCGKVWSTLAYSLSEGKGCPHCSAKQGAKNNKGKTGLKTHEQFVLEMAEVNPTLKIAGQYINGHSNIECICSICSHCWSAKPYSLLQNHSCPRCAKSGTSFMEQFIRFSFVKVLGKDNVISRDKKAIGMELDIYIPMLKVAIEPGNWNLHMKSIERDKMKRENCCKQGIKLITIYDKFPMNNEMPFADNCYIFTEDLNKADRRLIKELVYSLFETCGLVCDFSEGDWKDIEIEAYNNAKAKNHEDFVTELKIIHPNIEVLEKYQNANRRLCVRCNICNYEWNGVPASLLSGDGCKKCGAQRAHKKFIKNQKEFEKQVFEANSDIEIIGEYIGRHNVIRAKCRICGYEWEPRASSLLRGSNHKGWKVIHQNLER